MSSFIPAHEVHGEGDAVAFLLHGILGSGRNWKSFARTLAAAHPAWRFVTVDLRNHGDSSGAPPPHDLVACADDLAALAEGVGRPSWVAGHSFGGKVALVYARDHHDGTLHEVWTLDSTPGPRDVEGGEVERVIEACRALPLPAPSREAVVAHFRERGFSQMLAGWMTTNLRRTDVGFEWVFDLDAIGEMLRDYGEQDLWPFVDAPHPGLNLHVLRAGRSDRWSEAAIARLSRAGVDAPVLEGAGHWVHVDDPEGLRALLEPTLAT